jgi:HK97 family phage prohead protease
MLKETTLRKDAVVASEGGRWLARLSSAAVDRDGDRITGIQWPSDGRLPALLSHNGAGLPVGEWLRDPRDPYLATLRLAPPGISPEADMARGLLEAGILRGVSIGFRPRSATPNEYGGRDMIAELHEASLVAVPANTEAAVLHAVKALRRRLSAQEDSMIEIDGDAATVTATVRRAVAKALVTEGERLVKFWTPPGPDFERRDEQTRRRLRAQGFPVEPTWAAAQAAKAALDRPADPWPVSDVELTDTEPTDAVLRLVRSQLQTIIAMLAVIDENNPSFRSLPGA